jgi:hypothetical protein
VGRRAVEDEVLSGSFGLIVGSGAVVVDRPARADCARRVREQVDRGKVFIELPEEWFEKVDTVAGGLGGRA